MKKHRVVIVGTGNIAGIAARCLQGRQDVELVGMWGRSSNIGLDAGLLDTDKPCGVIITDSQEEILALRPDCAMVALNIRDPLQAQGVNGEWYIKLLENGINVVTASDAGLMYPPAHADQIYVARIDAAAKRGGATLYANGQEPGFVEHMAIFATTMSNTLKNITSYEIFDYSTVRERERMSVLFGFDEAPDYAAILERPGIQQMVWASPLANVANKLGYKVECYRESYEKRVAERDLKVGFGTIKAGKVAAVRVRTSAIVEGREAVAIEHVNRMCRDIAPEWEISETAGCMRVRIAGDPNISMECSVGDPTKPEELAYDGFTMTAMRIINSIPYVCAAPPGITTFNELPLTTPSSAFRSENTFVEHKIYRTST